MSNERPGSRSEHRPRVVALGGGHGLSASLSALRRLTPHLTAVVTVADDGGSSGKLRADMPWLLPPGDLRMAVCALAAEDPVSQAWADLLQQRFSGGVLDGHPVGNLLLAGLLQQNHEAGPELALQRLCELVGAVGTVLPLSVSPVDIEADVTTPDGEAVVVRGQVAVATTQGRVLRVRLIPPAPVVSADLTAALESADCVVLGPGSLFTSQLPHLLTPDVAGVLQRGVRLVHVLNLVPQPGETDGLDAAGHLDALIAQVPWLRPAVVVADEGSAPAGSAARARLSAAVNAAGGELVVCSLAVAGQPGVHDVAKLTAALDGVLTGSASVTTHPGVNLGSRLRQDGSIPSAQGPSAQGPSARGPGAQGPGGQGPFGSKDPAGAVRRDVNGERAWWQ